MTIKHGKGYQDTWSVFKGQPHEVREDLIDYFSIPYDQHNDLSLHEVVVNATTIAHGVGNVAGKLGGTVLSQGKQDSPPWNTSSPAKSGGDPWAQAQSTPAVPAENPLLALIKNAEDVPSLQRIWAENQAAFADAAVMDAWKAKGKALSGK
ncbi:hypothetical protein O7614_26580 [Micromonospora sp. WMMD961]|uniref:hypothetical protein n=1 Tax=Micromonospora sp. WMMD961 TaxID=3016100 RepID=UPI002416ACB9|nr:hypothetical protein [Micromonospora sp. WMMD961]MDG4783231.1 hypothetical protein [Micromonospora sp. WMMD961]